ncbi:hypothetical protein FBU30_009469, partial [Linnemannia zychae]
MSPWPKSTISVEEAISLVTSNIALIRQANNINEILNCRPDKVTEYKVNTVSNLPMLAQLAAAYREYAEILREKGFSETAKKSWRRADEILSPHQKQDTKSIVKAGGIFVAMVPAARMCLSSVHFNIHTTNLSTCTTLLPPQSPISFSSVKAKAPTVSRSVVYFEKNIYSFAFDMSFPSPNCHLQDTRQLAACLTLLCTTELPEDELTQEVRKWIVATRSNKDEIERLKKIANDVTYAFIKTDPKDAGVIAEVVPLAYNLDRDLYRHLLNSFLDV